MVHLARFNARAIQLTLPAQPPPVAQQSGGVSQESGKVIELIVGSA